MVGCAHLDKVSRSSAHWSLVCPAQVPHLEGPSEQPFTLGRLRLEISGNRDLIGLSQQGPENLTFYKLFSCGQCLREEIRGVLGAPLGKQRSDGADSMVPLLPSSPSAAPVRATFIASESGTHRA